MPHNKLHVGKIEEYTDEQAVKDMTQLVAEITSGLKGAIPESEDQDLAYKIVEMINTRFDED